MKLSQEEYNVSVIRSCLVNFPEKYVQMKTYRANLLDLTKQMSNIRRSRSWSKENSMEANCLQIAQRIIESRRTLHCVCECIPFQVARLPCLCQRRLFHHDSIHREPVKPNTLSARKAFPKTRAWFLYEVQRHPRWASTLGSLLNLRLNMPNKPTPLEISFEKLSFLSFFFFFFGRLF